MRNVSLIIILLLTLFATRIVVVLNSPDQPEGVKYIPNNASHVAYINLKRLSLKLSEFIYKYDVHFKEELDTTTGPEIQSILDNGINVLEPLIYYKQNYQGKNIHAFIVSTTSDEKFSKFLSEKIGIEYSTYQFDGVRVFLFGLDKSKEEDYKQSILNQLEPYSPSPSIAELDFDDTDVTFEMRGDGDLFYKSLVHSINFLPNKIDVQTKGLFNETFREFKQRRFNDNGFSYYGFGLQHSGIYNSFDEATSSTFNKFSEEFFGFSVPPNVYQAVQYDSTFIPMRRMFPQRDSLVPLVNFYFRPDIDFNLSDWTNEIGATPSKTGWQKQVRNYTVNIEPRNKGILVYNSSTAPKLYEFESDTLVKMSFDYRDMMSGATTGSSFDNTMKFIFKQMERTLLKNFPAKEVHYYLAETKPGKLYGHGVLGNESGASIFLQLYKFQRTIANSTNPLINPRDKKKP